MSLLDNVTTDSSVIDSNGGDHESGDMFERWEKGLERARWNSEALRKIKNLRGSP
jgi:hypothetical protein